MQHASRRIVSVVATAAVALFLTHCGARTAIEPPPFPAMDSCAYQELQWMVCGPPEEWTARCPCLEAWLGDIYRLYGDEPSR